MSDYLNATSTPEIRNYSPGTEITALKWKPITGKKSQPFYTNARCRHKQLRKTFEVTEELPKQLGVTCRQHDVESVLITSLFL